MKHYHEVQHWVWSQPGPAPGPRPQPAAPEQAHRQPGEAAAELCEEADQAELHQVQAGGPVGAERAPGRGVPGRAPVHDGHILLPAAGAGRGQTQAQATGSQVS